MAGGPATHREHCHCRACQGARDRATKAGLGTAGVTTGTVAKASQVTRNQIKAREVVARWLALRQLEPNLTQRAYAERLGVGIPTLRSNIQRGVSEGWLQLDDPMEQVEHRIVPLAVSGLNELLKQKDKTAILETNKGIIFPLYRESQGISDTQNVVLGLKIEMLPSPGGDGSVIEGQIVGAPKIFKPTPDRPGI